MKTTIASAGLACVLAVTGTTAMADGATGKIIGSSRLLDAGGADQLARWLGAGDIHLDPLYALGTGDTAAEFHAAADGKGANFILLDVTNPAGSSYLVGGYDPQSWSSGSTWNETPRDWQRTAFLFNMTVPAVYRQILSTVELPSQGLRQTFNAANSGPVFGSGPDLFVDQGLDGMISWQLSYGNPREEGLSIVDRSVHGENLRLDGMEVFAVTPVPEPGQAAMLAAGLLTLALAARARARAACVAGEGGRSAPTERLLSAD